MGRRIVMVDFDVLREAVFRDDRKRLYDGRSDMPFVVTDGVPEDARIVDVVSDPARRYRMACLVLESAEWSEDSPGSPLTAIHPTSTLYTSLHTYRVMQADCPAAVEAPK